MASDRHSVGDSSTEAIRESFGRVVYSHKTHEKAREIESAKATLTKWINILLSTLTLGTLLSTVITSQKVLLYSSGIASGVTLAFVIFQLSFDPAKEAERHRATAKELWYIREQYIHLLSDIKGDLDRVDIARRRDALVEELKLVYQFAPDTTSKAYQLARKALKISEEMTFSSKEIDSFLPASLHTE
jgi:hypothetical protein